MTRSDRPVARAAVVGGLALILGLALSACGRRGPLDAPPLSATDLKASDIQTDASGKPIAPSGQNKRLPIDWILD